jgi:hypothetical protein
MGKQTTWGVFYMIYFSKLVSKVFFFKLKETL